MPSDDDYRYLPKRYVICFDEPFKGRLGERCFVLEDSEGHKLAILQPLSEMGDGGPWEALVRLALRGLNDQRQQVGREDL